MAQKVSSYRIRSLVLPYTFIFPALFFLVMLMVYPMFVIIRYSLLDNVITNPTPVFVGLKHYIETIKDEIFRLSVLNTLLFTVMSVVFHLLIGLSFAMLLNVPINPILRSLLRVFFILPWLFTATIVAINWRLILDPMGIVNYILQKIGLISGHKE
jgi:multiple sugar transport system permease protein